MGLLLKKAREEKHLTQLELAELVDKRREYISKIENNGSNLTLKTLFDIVEMGLGGKVKISIGL
ncbi:helix-turn-helix transcriptional regulator [Sphingobacterium sp. B16(2022)]|uniref:helix-turn-helix transcriptional regulator n=1 Tax=unclassified Sphingobacterium TaxID=2609468 RepID=UPI00397A28CA